MDDFIEQKRAALLDHLRRHVEGEARFDATRRPSSTGAPSRAGRTGNATNPERNHPGFRSSEQALPSSELGGKTSAEVAGSICLLCPAFSRQRDRFGSRIPL